MLQKNWLLSSQTSAEADALLRFSGVRQLDTNQTLFWQGDAISHVFLVLDGSLKLIRRDRKDRSKITDVVCAPDLVALHCLFAGNGYTTTAVALQTSAALAINAERFLWQTKQNPELAWRVAVHLSREVEGMLGAVELVSMLSVDERLAAYLLDGCGDPDGRNGARIPKRRAELASLLSMTTETLCRVISRFRKQGLISTKDGSFTILDPDGLRRLIESRSGQ